MKTDIALPLGTLAALALATWTVRAASTLYTTTIASDRPLVYWNFDEADGNAIQQMPLSGVPATIENDLVPTTGATRVSHATLGSGLRLGNAADFNGSSFFRAAGMRSGKTALDGAYAVELWVQSQALNSATYLVNFGPSGGDNSPALIYNFTPDYFELFAGGGGRTGTSGPIMADQDWHHLVFVYYGDGSDGVAARVDAYLDGTEFPYISASLSKRLNPAALIVGAALPNNADAFTGRIDEVAVYDLSGLPDEAAINAKMQALVAAHIASASAASGTPYAEVVLADQPFLYWNFDETEGNARQLAPLAPPPTPDNTLNELSPQFNAVRISHTDAGSGLLLGNAIDLDGWSSYFGRTGGLDVGLTSLAGPWAVELWFQLQADQSARYLLNMGSTASPGYNSPALIYGYFGSRIEVYGAGRSREHGVVLTDRNWHHLLVVNYNNAPASDPPGATVNRVDFYIDNELHANAGGGFNKAVDFRDWLLFGAAVHNPDPATSGSMIGRMDELAIYNLSAYTNQDELTAKAAAMAASHYAAAFGSTSVGTITIASHPADATNQVGGTATFTVAATVTGTTSPLTYQWQRDGVSIDGATGSTYTLSPISLNDIGTSVYRVRVSAGPAFKFSNPATLTVATPPPEPATPYSRAVAQDAPLLYWNFDEMTGPALQQMPVGLKPVTSENDLVPVFASRVSHADIGSGLSKLGRAADCDGFSFYQTDTLRTAKANLAAPWAVEFWIQALGFNDPTGDRQDYLVNFGPGGGNAPAFIYDYKADQLEMFAGTRTDNGPTFNDTEWHHVLWVFYGDGTAGVANRVDAWFDGARFEKIRNNFTRTIDVTSRLLVGAALTDGTGGFEGRLDEVAVYDLSGAGDEASITAKATAMVSSHRSAATSGAASYSSVVLADSPFLYWNFDEAEGNALQLAPPNLPTPDPARNHLVAVGAGRVQHSTLGSGRTLGNAADLDGKAYFQTPQLDVGRPPLAPPWAVEFWMQVQGANLEERQDYLANFGANAPAFIYDFEFDELEIFAGVRTDFGPLVSDELWHHVLWVYYGDGLVGVDDRADAYLDGVPYQYVRNTFSRAIELGSSLLVGAATPGYNGFQGRIDELAVYDLSGLADEAAVTARVEQMVASHLNASTQAPTPDAVLVGTRSGNQLTLSWTVAGFVLQENSALDQPAGWSNVPGGASSPVVINLPATGNSYYRLKQ